MDLACINRPGYDPSFETYSGPYATLTNHESWNCTLEVTLHADGTLTAPSHFCWEAALKKFEGDFNHIQSESILLTVLTDRILVQDEREEAEEGPKEENGEREAGQVKGGLQGCAW